MHPELNAQQAGFDEQLNAEDRQEHGDYLYLQRTLKEVAGLDLSAYKEKQMLRRLRGFVGRKGLSSLRELADAVRIDPQMRQQLTDYLAINVTEFFRNPERFSELAGKVLPALRSRYDSLRVWSAGCSTGPEAYSVAILLEEMEPGSWTRHRVIGTDIDREALAEARLGIFSDDRLREVSEERRRRFFTALGDGRWQVSDAIRRYVKFALHDLLKDPYPAQQHLILCRNVIIYFTEEAKDYVFAKLAASLAPGGYLLLGSTETIFYPGRYGLKTAGPFLYVRTEE